MKKKVFLLLCLFIFIFSSCGRAQNNSESPEGDSVEVEYLEYNDFLTDISDEEKFKYLEQEIKDTLIQADGIADAEVSVLSDDSGYEVSVNLIYAEEAQGRESILEKWVEDHLNIVFAGEENLIFHINRD